MRELIVFDGTVECRFTTGPANLVLSGFEIRTEEPRSRHVAAAFFRAAVIPMGAPDVPPMLNAVRLFELDPLGGLQRYLIRCQELQLEFEANSVQLHRDAAREFFAALPPPAVPWRVRLGWTLLLWLLRIPGADRLLSMLRGTQ
jgi:hypothetical protein